MRRGLFIVLGVVAAVVGLVLLAGGALGAALLGPDSSLSTAPVRLTGSGVALVAEEISVDASSVPVPSSLGSLTLSVRSTAPRAMFVGAATADDVDAYLVGAPYDVVVDLGTGGTASTREVPGTQQPPRPLGQRFWTLSATGDPAELTARIGADSTLVVMNADASSGVDAQVVVTLTVDNGWVGSWVAVGAGVVLLVVAAFLLRAAARRRTTEEPPRHGAATGSSAATVLPGVVPDAATAPLAITTEPAVAAAATAPAPPAPPVAVVPEVDAAAPVEVSTPPVEAEAAPVDVAPPPDVAAAPPVDVSDLFADEDPPTGPVLDVAAPAPTPAGTPPAGEPVVPGSPTPPD